MKEDVMDLLLSKQKMDNLIGLLTQLRGKMKRVHPYRSLCFL